MEEDGVIPSRAEVDDSLWMVGVEFSEFFGDDLDGFEVKMKWYFDYWLLFFLFIAHQNNFNNINIQLINIKNDKKLKNPGFQKDRY